MPNVNGEQHHKRLKTHCPKGHELVEENVMMTKEKRWSKRLNAYVTYQVRNCRTCKRKISKLSVRTYRNKLKARESKLEEHSSLLVRIRHSRSLETLPILIRAFGCKTIVGVRALYSPLELIDTLKEYELDAEHVERSESLIEARLYLRKRGYYNVTKQEQAEEILS